MKTSSTKHTTLVSFAAIVASSTCGIVALCLSQTAGLAAIIQKKDGQVLNGQILGRIAIKSTTAVVTQSGQQYTAVYYLVADGLSITKIDSKDVTLGPGYYNVLAVSWSLSGGAMPPSDLAAVMKDSTIASPGGGPLVSGLFDSGAAWTQRLIVASVTGTVSALFAAAANLAGSTNIPALLAKPPTGTVLGEFIAYTDGGGDIAPTLNICCTGTPPLPVSDLSPFPRPSISTSAGTFGIGGAAVGDRFPLGCANGPGCSPPSPDPRFWP